MRVARRAAGDDGDLFRAAPVVQVRPLVLRIGCEIQERRLVGGGEAQCHRLDVSTGAAVDRFDRNIPPPCRKGREQRDCAHDVLDWPRVHPGNSFLW